MAGKGGYQKPAGPRPPSGVGKKSTRTDGNVQAVKVPNVGSSPDLQYGDRQMLENAQRIAPIGSGAGAGAAPRQPAGAPLAPGPLPGHLAGPSNRPGEPVTAGLPMGPGAGPEVLKAPPGVPDQREQVLMYLMRNYGNDSAAKMLNGIRNERQQPAPSAAPAGPPPAPAAPPAPPAAPTAPQGPPSG